MKSLFALEKRMVVLGYDTVYAFPESAGNHEWVKTLSETHKIYYLPIGKSSFRWRTYAIIKQIFTENKDIVIAHSHFECYDVPLNILAPNKVKVFWHLHNPINIGTKFRKFYRWLHYGLFSRNVHLLSVSEKYRRDVVGVGFRDENTCTILNGIDLNRIANCAIDAKPFNFITFGWDYYRKGVDIIIEACQLLIQEGIELRLVINGNNSTYSKLVQNFPEGVPSFINFVAFSENINEMFSQSMVYIQASRAETFSYSVAEAAYAGLPVISSDIPGLEWAHELPTVHFFETKNAKSLALLMRKLIDENIEKEKLQITRRIIEEKYAVSCWVRNIEQEYFK